MLVDMTERAELEALVGVDVRALAAESEQIGRVFAGLHDLAPNDFRALVLIMVADSAGTPLTSGELSRRMGVSGAAVTYLVERMIASGHIRRESDPADRRKVLLRYDDHGMTVARAFFTPLGEHTTEALAGLPDSDLAAAHRVLVAVTTAMRTFEDQLST